ncbi:hypothetical protein QUB11_31090, partial [Microcoleus sp. B6-A1]
MIEMLLPWRFFVALSFVQKLMKQYRETKNISPKTHQCGVKGKLNAEQRRERVTLAISINAQKKQNSSFELLLSKIGENS